MSRRPQQKASFYPDGRFATLKDVASHDEPRFTLGLTKQEQRDLLQCPPGL
jgi:hypothetical protein